MIGPLTEEKRCVDSLKSYGAIPECAVDIGRRVETEAAAMSAFGGSGHAVLRCKCLLMTQLRHCGCIAAVRSMLCR